MRPVPRKTVLICHGYEGLGGYDAKTNLFFPYQGAADTPDVLTIGRGHVLSKAEKASGRFAKGLTLAQVEELFTVDMQPRMARLDGLLNGESDDEFAAALSAFYNNEEMWLPTKTPGRCFNQGNKKACAHGMLLYHYSAGRRQLGLWRRRMSEALCLITGEVFISKDQGTQRVLQTKLQAAIGPIKFPPGMKVA